MELTGQPVSPAPELHFQLELKKGGAQLRKTGDSEL